MLLMSSACIIKALSTSHPTPAEGRLGVPKELGGSTAETAVPS